MIESERDAGIHTIRLAHGKANALDVELLEALQRELERTAGADAVVITATGSIFSAGVDLFRLTTEGEPYVRRFFPLLCSFVHDLFALPRPVVVAANGHAIAGGAIMVMAADYRLMADGNGRIGVPELLVGVPFPAAPLEVVRFAVPPHRLQSFIYTGETLRPRDALALGIVDEVVDPPGLEARARDIAERLAALPPANFRLTKQALRADTLERIRRDSERWDAEALETWTAPETHRRITEYLERVVRR
ncbi:MAG TPA: enoyl-CoA hydratase/isomerase family protein [Longimicrobiales bacterium]|nr:enoyl-CoA hydratase/isomerase family protein [Longimicrobiales bacterium]